MADNTQKMSYNAGVAKGQTQEKSSGMMGKANNAAQSAKKSVLGAGEQVKVQALGAVNAVKKATGMKK
ncbi:uncharacterized protein LOC116137789 [Pistacia vera]|uniref:Uncharacterized protein n=1 Tax=Pistacia atlantica TaxID=434234 RepID=A0ACC1BL24_9ROSI|nr:uncharacterized protein LOC116137789 [Pistacia vera]KAJ0099671.1 hypothetical protein Patl1_21557 [Pistacia atlantica]